jgi:predicted dehydrogenase
VERRYVAMRVACIGVGGQGWFNLRAVARCATVTLLCDCDSVALARAQSFLPGAKACANLEDVFTHSAEFDAVVISTPDYVHAEAISRALRRGKHCFCEKPLVQSEGQLRIVADSLEGYCVATCVGTQGVFSARFSHLVRLFEAIPLSEIDELLLWTDRPGEHWEPTRARLSVTATRPAEVAGCYRERPASFALRDLHPMRWRHYVAYGSGAIGDMGAHLFALPLIAFGLRGADSISVVRQSVRTRNRYAESLELSGTLRSECGAIPFRWFQGQYAPVTSLGNVRQAENGLLLRHGNRSLYVPEWNVSNAFEISKGRANRLFDDFDAPDEDDMFEAWFRACQEGTTTRTDFATFAFPLNCLLLGLLNASLEAR